MPHIKFNDEDTAEYGKGLRHEGNHTLNGWPRRLLHVRSMTSVERQGVDVYKGIKAPAYNAISYTWGRWAADDSDAIKIKNVSWKIPGIQPSHFTVEEFNAAIRKAAENGNVDFIWLDIACIDQGDPKIKLDEINNQVAIYKRASFVYAWVVPWTTQDMLRSLYIIEAYDLSQEEPQMSRYRLVPTQDITTPSLNEVSRALNDISAQPWFTSLWTLQEAYLCEPDLLSRSGDLLEHSLFLDRKDTQIHRPVHLTWVNSMCWKIWTKFNRDPAPVAQEICRHIVDSGILSLGCRNAAVLYGASAKRTAMDPLDSVYGIMQVYNIKMDPHNDLRSLMDTFSLRLNRNELIGAQLFLHEKSVPRQETWKLSRSIHIPLLFLFPFSSNPSSRIENGPQNRPLFTGASCNLKDLLTVWESVFTKRKARPLECQPRVYLDATESSSCRTIHVIATANDTADEFADTTSKVSDLPSFHTMLPEPIKNYRVLYLGSVRSGLHSLRDPLKAAWNASFKIGLLVLRDPSQTSESWSRIGFCSWLDSSENNKAIHIESKNYDIEDEILVPAGLWEECSYML
ncbi:hypothetical protein CC78DRAFT_522758 [Lojkania enalia]|uniref:Heterokaryon incompatibility domain-containing protein n=1 Tax=Lojkania enalia TaxID=147567 RepID=A0A9P4K1F7_9PLEO|nr:hypothetical protein CC78DRAFT_522758 [Didymosphaeria enalia]